MSHICNICDSKSAHGSIKDAHPETTAPPVLFESRNQFLNTIIRSCGAKEEEKQIKSYKTKMRKRRKMTTGVTK